MLGVLRTSYLVSQQPQNGVQVADGLQFLHHEANLVHRGLSPGAVLVTAAGAWKLGGLALATRAQFGAANDTAVKPFDFSDAMPPTWRILTQVSPLVQTLMPACLLSILINIAMSRSAPSPFRNEVNRLSLFVMLPAHPLHWSQAETWTRESLSRSCRITWVMLTPGIAQVVYWLAGSASIHGARAHWVQLVWPCSHSHYSSSRHLLPRHLSCHPSKLFATHHLHASHAPGMELEPSAQTQILPGKLLASSETSAAHHLHATHTTDMEV